MLRVFGRWIQWHLNWGKLVSFENKIAKVGFEYLTLYIFFSFDL